MKFFYYDAERAHQSRINVLSGIKIKSNAIHNKKHTEQLAMEKDYSFRLQRYSSTWISQLNMNVSGIVTIMAINVEFFVISSVIGVINLKFVTRMGRFFV